MVSVGNTNSRSFKRKKREQRLFTVFLRGRSTNPALTKERKRKRAARSALKQNEGSERPGLPFSERRGEERRE